MSDAEREATLDLVRRVGETSVGDRLVLGGSAGFFAASETVPPFTEDVDFFVDEAWLAEHEDEVRRALEGLGFVHHPGTPVFTSEAEPGVDLVGYSLRHDDDRIGGGTTIPVMVFGDLGRLFRHVGAVRPGPQGGRILAPAPLAASKLLTVRAEKGAKDKLQTLLLLDERADDMEFQAELRRFLSLFPEDRRLDALADAQVDLLALSGDALLSGPQASRYGDLEARARRGLAHLDISLSEPR